ncbi:response regulator [Gemmata sp. JC673]|uniref:Response regulator n=1 Tax=Gemmata algarum TaxID=2975278 RepID=A0ABU5F1R3_9BACT|nr:response regulator [Gemmata algarum]MDY3561275.1 response regulator [Gemmata algarum]
MPHVLLVEDEQVNREMFRRRLERKGYTVLPADTGLGAVALARSERPDVILMDLGLPDIDGWEATRRLKADPVTAPVPIIVLSAHATFDAKDKAFAAGCQDFETKPVNWDALFRKLDEWLAKGREAAAAHAEPEPDPGATLLPDSPAPPKAERADTCAVGPKRILVVEDNDANRVMLCRRLGARGFQTVEAANGREALDAVRRAPFDLVLCDIMMPEVDGYEVLRQLKADPALRDLPVIMVSALDETAEVVRCIEMGAEDYLHKPYDPVLLHARVNACLDKKRLRDQEVAYLQSVAALTRAAELVERGEFDPALLAPVVARGDDLGQLARVFDRMAREVQAREQRHKDDVRHLTQIEFDAAEVAREVARVTASAAFEKAARLAAVARARRQGEPSPTTETVLLHKLK